MIERRISVGTMVRLLAGWRDGRRGAAYHLLRDTVRVLILDGRLPLGAKLPGERELAKALGVSRTTVSTAYGALKADGLLVSRHGSGSVTSIPEGRGRPWLDLDDDRPEVIDLSIAALPANETVYHAYAEALAAMPAYLPGNGYHPLGLPQLRQVLADRYSAAGVPTEPEQILITQGAQQGFQLVLSLLTRPGHSVVIEHPSYPLAIDAIQRASCRVVPVGLTGAEWDAAEFIAAARQTDASLIYLQPDYHNPTGFVMSEDARTHLVAAAARSKAYLVSDETMSDLALEGPRLRPLAAFDRADKVISIGSMAKTYWGGLRTGWIRADAQTIAGLARVRVVLDLGSPVLEQLASAALLKGNQEPLQRRFGQLRENRDALADTLNDLLPDWRFRLPAGGLCLWAEMPEPVTTALANAAEGQGVRLAPGTRFGVGGAFSRYIRLPYTHPQSQLLTAVETIARVYRDVRLGRSPRPAVEDRRVEAI